MNTLLYLLLVIILGLLAVTMIATFGATLSKKLNFNYGLLTALSTVVYMLISYFVLVRYSFILALLSCYIVGLYDATVCWALCKKYKANFGKYSSEVEKMTVQTCIASVFAFASFCAIITDLILL
jgi:hypothetical protein